jgi:hypothetical protein
MIGTRAFLIQLPPLLIPIFALFAIVAVILRSRRRFAEDKTANRSKRKLAGVAALAIFVLMGADSAYRLVRQVQYHSKLENLRPESVRAIKVGNVQLDKVDDVKAVILALAKGEWYEPTAGDGGRAASVEMIIEFKSGDEVHYPIARHRRFGGAVIGFVSQDRNSATTAMQ